MKSSVLVWTLFVSLGSATLVDAAPYGFATKAWSGDTIDGETLAGVSLFHDPYILPDGQTFFVGDTASGEQAFMSEQQIAVITGAQVGGAASGTLVEFLGQAVVNDLAEIVMTAFFSGPAVDSSNDSGVLVCNGTCNLELQKGTPVVGTTDASDFFVGLGVTNAGDHVYNALLSPSGEEAIYYTPAGGTPQVVQVTGEMRGDERLESVSTVSTNASRRTALYLRKWLDPAIGSHAGELTLRDSTDFETLVFLTGVTGHGLPTGTAVEDMFVPKANDSDDVALFIEFAGATSGRSIHVLELNTTSVIGGRSAAMTDQTAPGFDAATFSFFQNFVLNNVGRVAFNAIVDDLSAEETASASAPQEGVAPITGIWFEDAAGVLQLAGHNGMQAPGLDPGVTIEQIGFPAFNDLHQVAFKSALAGPGVEFFVNDEALWATDLTGDLQLVVRTGDLFDVNDDPNIEDLRTIRDIGTIANSAGTGGQSTSFNDSGELAFTLSFSDFTSGVFVASLATPSLPTDLDGDNDVDGADFIAVQQVDPSLIPMWEAAFGSGVGASISAEEIPEPRTILLLAIAAIASRLQRADGSSVPKAIG